MRKTVIKIAMSFAAALLLVTGTSIFIGYSMAPDDYGFYDIWSSYLYMSAGLTIMGILLMAGLVRKVDRMLF